MRPAHSEHPELTGRQVGDKCEIMRPEHSEHPELTGRQVGNKWDTSVKSCGQSTQSIQSLLGDKWETSVKSCGQSTQSIQSLLGDKWETSVKSCGQALKASRAYWEARNTSPETNSKSSGPSMHPFKRSKNPSQVNLFGELYDKHLQTIYYIIYERNCQNVEHALSTVHRAPAADLNRRADLS